MHLMYSHFAVVTQHTPTLEVISGERKFILTLKHFTGT